MPWLCWFTNSRISCLCMCKKKPPSGGLVFFQFFNSNIGYVLFDAHSWYFAF
ncbi:hypothetical protein GZ804_003682 [Escherichia coli]|nr:hypothetical protein [Escherichia coli]EFI3718452.1 hypothetical protein [Escherichia coli]EFI3739981.1 hypothetical protein [Escherichia coli]EFI3832045.1 hypothetical protein [Escherichia coli]EFI3928661.1 hypothetical protein [Escherichia coli]